ncbi:MAG: CoA-transferase [Rhodospirillaceae bacterium]
MTDLFQSDLSALARQIPPGASVAINKGEGPDVPMALAKEIVRQGIRGLKLITIPASALPVSGMMVDMLIGAGCVKSIETSGVSMSELGAAPRFTKAVKDGALQVLDATCPAVLAALHAGAKGQPFASLRGIVGSDLEKHRDDFKLIDNPFEPGDPVVVLKAINPDVAIFHARYADRDGNVWIGRHRDQLFMAHASKKVLVTVEEVVDRNFYDDEAMVTGMIPSFYIDAICEAPGGALPMGLDGNANIKAVLAYMAAARTDEGFQAWLDENVLAGAKAAAE